MTSRRGILAGLAALLPGAALLSVAAPPPAAARSKDREPPAEVPPVVIGGRRYEVVHWGKSRGLPQNGGYVAAIDAASGREVWLARIYRVPADPRREGDKTDVFITRLAPSPDRAALLVESERGDRYRLDLRTRRVRRD